LGGIYTDIPPSLRPWLSRVVTKLIWIFSQTKKNCPRPCPRPRGFVLVFGLVLGVLSSSSASSLGVWPRSTSLVFSSLPEASLQPSSHLLIPPFHLSLFYRPLFSFHPYRVWGNVASFPGPVKYKMCHCASHKNAHFALEMWQKSDWPPCIF